MPEPRPRPQRSTPGPGSRGLLPVGRFFGVPLYFAPSWLIIALFITAGAVVLWRTIGAGLRLALTNGSFLPRSALMCEVREEAVPARKMVSR